jgi:hypothetical protein
VIAGTPDFSTETEAKAWIDAQGNAIHDEIKTKAA